MPTSSAKTSAIVIRVVEFSETSLVVTLFTRDFGKIGGLAKGARRLKNPFESALDLLALCRIVFLHKSTEALDILTEAKLVRRFRPPGKDLGVLFAGYYVAELLDGLTKEDDPNPELFDLADKTLAMLSAGTEPAAKLTVHFELAALKLLGHVPAVEQCVECGEVMPATTGPTAFGLLDGGVLCPRCRGGKKEVLAVGADVLRIINQLADPFGQAWQRIKITNRAYAELRRLLDRYIAHLLGRETKLRHYLPRTEG